MPAMDESPSFLVYSLLGRFLESRGLSSAAETTSLGETRERFAAELDHFGFFRHDAVDGGGRAVVFLILALRGKVAERGPALRELIAGLGTEAPARAGRLAEVAVIAPEDVAKKRNMTDVVHAFRAPGAGETIYNIYPYRVFSLDVPRAQCVPRHEVATPAEVAALLARERLAVGDLRKISADDPPVVWAGGRPGQVVRIRADSEVAAEAFDYCLVI